MSIASVGECCLCREINCNGSLLLNGKEMKGETMKMKKRDGIALCLALLAAVSPLGLRAQVEAEAIKTVNPVDNPAIKTGQEALDEDPGERKVEIVEDRDQDYMATKIYELKNVKSADLMPFIAGAVQRYNGGSTVERLDYVAGKKQYIVVNTAYDMMPYVDDMVAKLDRPGKLDSNGSLVDGDGIYRFVYCPKHRYYADMNRLGPVITMGDGAYFDDASVSMFYWKDSKSEGEKVLKWLQVIDRPVPQAEIKIKVYMITDNDIKELGIDYLNWKNGPGAEFFSTGADIMHFRQKEQLFAEAVEVFSNFGEAWGGMMFAPQFDASFIKMLDQKGKATVASSGSLVMVNNFSGTYTLSLTPGYQNIVKNEEMAANVVESMLGDSYFLTVNNPIICFKDPGDVCGTLMFNYEVLMRSVVERNNAGTEFVNENTFSSTITLATGTEKFLASFNKEEDVEEYIGMPFFGDVPVLKYLFGTQVHSKSMTRVIVTVVAEPIRPEQSLSAWAGQIVNAAEMLSTGTAEAGSAK